MLTTISLEPPQVNVPSGRAIAEHAHFENSDVLPSGSVAVAVTAASSGKTPVSKTARPSGPVVTVRAPRNVSPSPYPLASHAAPPKTSIRPLSVG